MCFTVANPIPIRLRIQGVEDNVDQPRITDDPAASTRNVHLASEAYSAFYIYDTAEEANEKRQKMRGCESCPEDLISLLTNVSRERSPFMNVLRSLFAHEQNLKENNTPIPPLDIRFSKPNPYQPLDGKPKHSVNVPTSGEISIVTLGPEVPKHPGFTLPMGNGELRFLPYTDANSDPVCFFLLFLAAKWVGKARGNRKGKKMNNPQR
jgi:hypothetical protein